MEATRTRAFGPARIVALALISVAVLSGYLVNTFFDSGRVDASRYTLNRIDFAAGTSQGEIAKIALGAMLGLAALTVFLLLWLPLRLRRRGSFGPAASGALRSASPLLFGLGGWFTGVLVVLMALPARFAADAIEIPEPATR